MVGGGMKAMAAGGSKRDAYTYLFKICLVGSAQMGKTSAMRRFTHDDFDDNYATTIGVDFAIKEVEMGNGEPAKLQIWDTAGAERFRTITNSYYRGTNGIVIFFDLTDRESFQNVERWIEEVQRYASEDVVIIIAGTKSDLGDDRVVTSEELSTMAREQSLDHVEISSKTGKNVFEMFEMIVEKMIEAKREFRSTQYDTAMSTMVGAYGKKGKPSTNKSKTCILL